MVVKLVWFSTVAGWDNKSTSKIPLIGILITIAVGCAIIAILTTVCLVVVCKRKGGHVPPPAGPAHWSTTVTVTPECRPALRNDLAIQRPRSESSTNGRQRPHDQDRMALIAYSDGGQTAALPSYEEALRDSGETGNGHTRIGVHPSRASHNGSTSSGGVDVDNISSPPHGPTILGSGVVGHVRGSPLHNGNGNYHSNQTRNRGHPIPNGVNRNGGVSRTKRQRNNGYVESGTLDLTQHWQQQQHQMRIRSRHHGRSGRNSNTGNLDLVASTSDAGADNVSGNSVQVYQRHHPGSGTASLRSQSGGSSASVETVNGVIAPGSAQVIANTNGQVGGHFAASTGGPDCSASTHSAGSSSQTPSCRALAGSLASFDTSSIVNTEGIPLLEENEGETENSATSEPGDTGSATYSEGSSKN